jgi:hypothetical protein
MKNFSFLILLFFIGSSLFSQAPNWSWAKKAGSDLYDSGLGITTDANGNVYVAGLFENNSINFGSPNFINVQGPPYKKLFIVKYDSSGNTLWARSASGGFAYSKIVADINGNVYVTGYFGGASINFGTISLTNTGTTNMFIAKYDSNGNILWAKIASGNNPSVKSVSIDLDYNGNALITGNFDSPSITIGTITLNNNDSLGISSDIFIAKYDSNGNLLWAKKAGGNYYEDSYSITTDIIGNAYITGFYASSSITFSAYTLNNSDATGNTPDIFIAKYDSSGNLIWAKSEGGQYNQNETGYCIRNDSIGNIYVTGWFDKNINIGAITLTNTDTTQGVTNAFIAKYDSSGNLIWAKNAGGFSDGWSLDASSTGYVYLTGHFMSNSITFGTTNLTNTGTGSTDSYIVKYDTNGNVIWAKSIGYTSFIQEITSNQNDNIYITGGFSSTINFDTYTLMGSSDQSYDMFVSKLGNSSILGVDEVVNSFMTIYPNPLTNFLIIKTNKKLIGKKYTIKDANGKLVLSDIINSEETLISMEEFAAGVYFISVEEFHKKIILIE